MEALDSAMHMFRNTFHSAEGGEQLTHMLELASDAARMDMPVCGPCVIKVSDRCTRKLDDLSRENGMYGEFLRSIGESYSQLEQIDLGSLEEQETRLMLSLKELEERKASLTQKRRSVRKGRDNLHRAQAEAWSQVRALEVQSNALSISSNAISRELVVGGSTLASLSRTNVYDDAFHIMHDGHFGTINGFRLGKLQSQSVPWEEINAALGQCTLLLDTMARSVKYKFKKYQLVPKGSFSRIVKITDMSVVDLHHQQRLFNRGFDLALSYFVHCVQELGEFIEETDGKPVLKYE